jgi:hypothetical protein
LAIVAKAGVTAMLDAVFAEAVKTAVLLVIPDKTAVMLLVPEVATAVAKPVALIVATAGVALVQTTWLVILAVVLSE